MYRGTSRPVGARAGARRLAFVLSLACAAAGCGGDAAAEGDGPPRPASRVEVGHPRDGALSIERTYLGLVRSVARSELAAGASGEVLEVTVREGDRVQAGQLLLRVDADLAQADLRAARAAARTSDERQRQAAREADRYQRAGSRLVGDLAIERAGAEADVLASERQSSQASVARARASLSRHRVVAPFDGVIAARHVDPGDWVSPGTTALELVADDETEVLVRVEPGLLEDVGPGFAARLSAGGREADAAVVGVVRALDPATRTAQVRLSTEPAAWLLPGATVDVRFVVEHQGEGLIVPRDAIVEGVTATRVVRVVDGLAQPVDVTVIERGATEVRVQAEGLSTDDVVVTRGNERLRPEQPVEVVEP